MPNVAKMARLFTAIATLSVSLPTLAAYSNLDLRQASTKDERQLLQTHIARQGATHATRREAAAEQIRAAKASLEHSVPGVAIVMSDRTGGVETITIRRGNAKLRSGRGETREQTLRRFLDDNAALYGMSRAEVAGLRKSTEYTNPSGNLSWISLEREINGLKVFRGSMRAGFTANGDLFATVGELPAGVEGSTVATRPNLSAADAVILGAQSVGRVLQRDDLQVQSETPREVVFRNAAFTHEVRAQLLYFPLDLGAVELAWSFILWNENEAYWTIVGAEGGDVLWRKNIVNDQTQSVTYKVYDSDSPGPFSPSTSTPTVPVQAPGVARTAFSFISELPAFDNLGWITDGGNVTTGNNVDAGLDIAAPDGIDPTGRATGSPFRTFDFPYTPGGQAGEEPPTSTNYRQGAVTNLFFWSNRYHDRLYQYGFTEAAGNFQTNNFGRGGAGNDAVRAEAQDYSGTNNANFGTPPDGSPGQMQMYIFSGPTPDRDGDLDQEIVLHELTHGTSNRLHGNASGLNTSISGGMGEGWSDFYARALLSTADENINGVYPMGGYSTYQLGNAGYISNYYYGIRRFPYALKSAVGPGGKSYNPLTFADIDNAQDDFSDAEFPRGPIGSSDALEVHNVGEVWAMMLIEVRGRVINHMGFAGNDRMLQITTDGMKLDPVDPSFLDGRDSILAADCAAFAGADEMPIWQGFATRGLGASAQGTAYSGTVVEAYDLPNLLPNEAVITDAAGNGNGYPDPGETISISIGLTNPYCGAAIDNVTATLSGVPGTYGTIAAGATVSHAFAYTVPANAVCGSTITLPFNVTSSLTPLATTVSLVVGSPNFGSPQSFDGVTPPALPAGWTSSASGDLVAWTTSAINPYSSPNDATTTYAGSTGDAPGLSELISAPFSVSSPNAQLEFRNVYNLEGGFDGAVLEISINGGAYQDIIAAGGSFVSGGYSGTISSSWSNPLAGRSAWTGLSAGSAASPAYILTAVNLPAAANGMPVRFKWRFGTDNGTIASGSAGIRIDDVRLLEGYTCSAVGPTLHHFTIDPVADQFAGVPFAITITAKSASEETVTSFTGTVTIADGHGTITPTTSGSFTAGVRTEMVTITQPGQRVIGVANGLRSGTSNSFVVASLLDHFTVDTVANQTAGDAFSIVITAKDASDQTVTSYTGTVTISDTSGTITPTTSGAFTAGVRNEIVTITGSGVTAIGVNDGIHSGTSNSFLVEPPLAVGAITPNNGPHTGGTSITLVGTRFTATTTVTIGGTAADATFVDSTTLTVNSPALGAGTLNDVVVTDGPLSATLGKGWLSDFLDVPQSHGFHNFVEAIFRAGITGGCSGGNYCLNDSTTRAQMAVFLLVAKNGTSFTPPPATGTVFDDVAVGSFAAAWIEKLAADGITGGCSSNPSLYCPSGAVTRGQMAVFLIKAHDGTVTPGTPSGIFEDVLIADPFAWWIEELYVRGITGGCSTNPLRYCPANAVTRGEMAVFLTTTWNLPMN